VNKRNVRFWPKADIGVAARDIFQAIGFRILYNHMIFKGRNRDTAWYSILDDEWPEVREIMERWLAPRISIKTALPKPRWAR